jgi:heme A synthase
MAMRLAKRIRFSFLSGTLGSFVTLVSPPMGDAQLLSAHPG